jgi:hypothetical protein
MTAFVDLTGQRFGKLSVIRPERIPAKNLTALGENECPEKHDQECADDDYPDHGPTLRETMNTLPLGRHRSQASLSQTSSLGLHSASHGRFA